MSSFQITATFDTFPGEMTYHWTGEKFKDPAKHGDSFTSRETAEIEFGKAAKAVTREFSAGAEVFLELWETRPVGEPDEDGDYENYESILIKSQTVIA